MLKILTLTPPAFRLQTDLRGAGARRRGGRHDPGPGEAAEGDHDGLVVLGTASPAETVDLMFQRIKSIENALKVEGAATVDEGFEKLFVRVRNIEAAVKDIQTRLG